MSGSRTVGASTLLQGSSPTFVTNCRGGRSFKISASVLPPSRAFAVYSASAALPAAWGGLGRVGSGLNTIYIFTVRGSASLKLRVDSAGKMISLLPV